MLAPSILLTSSIHMLEIHCIDGRNCPVIVCDICGDRLAEASKAAAVFQNFMPDGAKLRLLHVHKGSIDGHSCHAEAEALLGMNGEATGGQEMKAYLADLAANAGFPAAQMMEYEERRPRFDM